MKYSKFHILTARGRSYQTRDQEWSCTTPKYITGREERQNDAGADEEKPGAMIGSTLVTLHGRFLRGSVSKMVLVQALSDLSCSFDLLTAFHSF
jgi:hypothetical protein